MALWTPSGLVKYVQKSIEHRDIQKEFGRELDSFIYVFFLSLSPKAERVTVKMLCKL